jgi:thiamine biosynthesis lipoprotein ApbE
MTAAEFFIYCCNFSLFQQYRQAMGTRIEVFHYGNDREHIEAVAADVLEEIERLDRVLSRFDPRCEIARINREAVERPVRSDRDIQS